MGKQFAIQAAGQGQSAMKPKSLGAWTGDVWLHHIAVNNEATLTAFLTSLPLRTRFKQEDCSTPQEASAKAYSLTTIAGPLWL
ncbi:vacuolar protein sorting-associated protein Vps13 [Aspergillus luchuensis]|uniref:Vacuolar protein sorting-associated protein Vps13 n=1 Tax=Aspergillus kawachii TaxID=1069201 RepID=A0A146FFJ0_ASPKA|nr:vacuolar protein sorting-associated protein Vps13 [Aspergillus luchuensis]